VQVSKFSDATFDTKGFVMLSFAIILYKYYVTMKYTSCSMTWRSSKRQRDIMLTDKLNLCLLRTKYGLKLMSQWNVYQLSSLLQYSLISLTIHVLLRKCTFLQKYSYLRLS